MTPINYLIMLAGVLSLAAALDNAWLRFVRPYLSHRFDWPDVRPDERIDWVVWVYVGLFLGSIWTVYQIALLIAAS